MRALQVAEASAECLAHYRCVRINAQVARILAPPGVRGLALLVAKEHAVRAAPTTVFTAVEGPVLLLANILVTIRAYKDVQECVAIRVGTAV